MPDPSLVKALAFTLAAALLCVLISLAAELCAATFANPRQNPASPRALVTVLLRGIVFGVGCACAWAGTRTILAWVPGLADQN